MPKPDASNVAEMLRQNGSLHLQAYLLRLLDQHRPLDPLSFLHSVLHRSQGGMALSLPMLAEFVSSTHLFPRSALVRTLVYSTRDTALDLTCPLHRQITLDAAALLTRSVDDDQLPSTDELANLDASASAHLIASVARSRTRILKRLGAGADGSGAGGTHRLRLVLELDATTPAAARCAMDLVKPPCTAGGIGGGDERSLLFRVAAEVAWLTMNQPQKCRVAVVIVGQQSQFQLVSSPASRLLGFVKELVDRIEPPALREAFTVACGNSCTALFPALSYAESVVSGSSSTTTGGRGSQQEPEVVTMWIREPKFHSHIILQAGHFIEPFAASTSGAVLGFPETALTQQMVLQRQNAVEGGVGGTASALLKDKGAANSPLVPAAVPRSSLLLTHLLHSMLSMALPQDASSVPSLAASVILLKSPTAEALGKLRVLTGSASPPSSAVSVAARLVVQARLEVHHGAKIHLVEKNEAATAGGSNSGSGSVPCVYTLVGQGFLLPPQLQPAVSPQDEVAALQEAATTIRLACITEAAQDTQSFPWEKTWSVLTPAAWTDLVVSDPLAQLSAHPAVAAATGGQTVLHEFQQSMSEPGKLSVAKRHVAQYLGEDPPALLWSTTALSLSPSYIAEKPFWIAHLPPPTPPKVQVEKKKPGDPPAK